MSVERKRGSLPYDGFDTRKALDTRKAVQEVLDRWKRELEEKAAIQKVIMEGLQIDKQK